jgi:hypothetical protein
MIFKLINAEFYNKTKKDTLRCRSIKFISFEREVFIALIKCDFNLFVFDCSLRRGDLDLKEGVARALCGIEDVLELFGEVKTGDLGAVGNLHFFFKLTFTIQNGNNTMLRAFSKVEPGNIEFSIWVHC